MLRGVPVHGLVNRVAARGHRVEGRLVGQVALDLHRADLVELLAKALPAGAVMTTVGRMLPVTVMLTLEVALAPWLSVATARRE